MTSTNEEAVPDKGGPRKIGCCSWLVIVVALTFAGGWTTGRFRDRWIERIETLYPDEVRAMEVLTERVDDLMHSEEDQELEALLAVMREAPAIVEARADRRRVRDDGALGVGSWTFFLREARPGETIINVHHMEGREYFEYAVQWGDQREEDSPGFSITFDADAVRAAWKAREAAE